VVPPLGVTEPRVQVQRPAGRRHEPVDLADRDWGVGGGVRIQDRLMGMDHKPGVVDGGDRAGQLQVPCDLGDPGHARHRHSRGAVPGRG